MTQKKTLARTVLIVAGGTGGHVFPGIAVARALSQLGCKVVWLGTKKGLDAKLVPQEGIIFYQISMVGFRGKGFIRKVTTPFRLFQAVLQAMWVIIKIKPDTVLGMGGYVTAPAGIAAWLLRKKLVIHEQNAIAGMANRYLAKLANNVLQAFPNTFKQKNVVTVGNPVRQSIAELPAPAQRLAEHKTRLHVLIVGGSLGAHAINQIMPTFFAELKANVDITHQTGALTYEATLANYKQLGVSANVVEFIDDIEHAYAAADIIICRAGALTVSEIAAAGLASILIPLPTAVDDHQTANANYLTHHNAAILLPQTELTVDKLLTIVQPLFTDRQTLIAMAVAARALAMPNAIEAVVNYC